MANPSYRPLRRNIGLAGTFDASVAEINSVLRNTYMLLAITVAFSALMAGVGMAIQFPHVGLLTLIPYFAFLFGAYKLRNSPWGLVMVFGLTGWLGLTLAPILSFYLGTIGPKPILFSLGGTAAIFFALSSYVLITRKNLSSWGGFLFVGILVAFVAAIANAFLQIATLSLVISSVFILVSSGLIMYQTSAIIHGGERNYILATIGLYVMLYNLFISLLNLFSFFSRD